MDKYLTLKQPNEVILQNPLELGFYVETTHSVDPSELPYITITAEHYKEVSGECLEWARTAGIIGNQSHNNIFRMYYDNHILSVGIWSFSMIEPKYIGIQGCIVNREDIPKKELPPIRNKNTPLIEG